METTLAAAAKEPILSLLFGTAFVCFITLPYFYGIGKSIATHQQNEEVSLLKFLALPFVVHLIATMGAIMFSNIWDLIYTDLQSNKLINTFWSASAQGATNAWVKAAYSSAELASMILYYLIIAIPAVNFVVVYIFSDRVLNFQHQETWGAIKSGAIKIAASAAIAGLLTIFYQKTVDVAMFDKQTLDFKEWGTASNSVEMQANFYKRIARMGASGTFNIGTRGSGSSSSIPNNHPNSSLLDAYFNNK